MTSWVNALKGRISPARMALWVSAAIIAFAAHAAAVAWALREPPAEMADSAAPPAIMIELAAAPEALQTETNDISEQMENSEAVKSDAAEPAEQPAPEERRPEEPREEIAPAEPQPVDIPEPEPAIDPLEAKPLTELENIEIPIPVSRMEPEKRTPAEKPKPKKKEPVRELEREKPATPQKASTQAAAQVAPSNRNAASQTMAGRTSGSASPAKWQSRLMAHLERRKRYPPGSRSRREQGTAYVRFHIDDAGTVLSVSLTRSSGFAELDHEVVEMVRRASPVPAPPPGAARTITAPVKFTVR